MSRLHLRSPARGLAKAAMVMGQTANWRLRGAPSAPGLRILYWHRVTDDGDQLSISPARFRQQLEVIAASGQRVIDLTSLDELTLEPDEKALALNFDDGYLDVVENALPALAERGWPSTVFVVPEVVEGHHRYKWYPDSGQPAAVGWDAMRELEKSGLVHFEPHTLTHPDLRTLDDEAAWNEIAGSKTAVEAKLGRPARLFCYPGGYHAERDVRLAEEAGYMAAVSCEYGVNRPPFDRFRLQRIIVDRYDSAAVFAARLRGATDRAPLGSPSRRDA